MFSSSNFDIEHPENSSENGGEDDGFLGYVHDGDEMMIDSEFGQNADEAIIREEAESNPEFAKSTLEKTILIDDSLEADVFRDEQEQVTNRIEKKDNEYNFICRPTVVFRFDTLDF